MYPGMKFKVSHDELKAFMHIIADSQNKFESSALTKYAYRDIVADLMLKLGKKQLTNRNVYDFSLKPIEIMVLFEIIQFDAFPPNAYEYNLTLCLFGEIDRFKVNLQSISI